MRLLFPCEPFSPRQIDSAFTHEYEAACLAGFTCEFYSHEDLTAGEISAALRTLRPIEDITPVLVRGWMIPGETYRLLHRGLLERGYQALVAPLAYERAHYLPLAYSITRDHTARSAWIEGDDEEQAWHLYQDFRSGDAIIKDWVKSAKARWKEACFIPAGTARERFGGIFRAFRQERDLLFNRGVVIREFLPLVELDREEGGYPSVEETRLFFWQGECLLPMEAGPMAEIEHWRRIAQTFESPFMTIDVARLKDGSWKIVETGDGQVSGLPPEVDPLAFYSALQRRS